MMTKNITKHGLDLVIARDWLPTADADNLLKELLSTEYLPPEMVAFRIYDKVQNIPRKQVAFGDAGTAYRFIGNSVPARDWTPTLAAIRDRLQSWLAAQNIVPEDGPALNFALVNLYRDGDDYLGPHRDDERDLQIFTHRHPGGEPIIVSLSVGAARSFEFVAVKNGPQAARPTQTISLGHGDLLIMRGETNRWWKHSVPKMRDVTTPRINLTFRFLVPPLEELE